MSLVIILFLWSVAICQGVDKIGEDAGVRQPTPRGSLIQTNVVTLRANGIDSANSALYLANITAVDGTLKFATVQFHPPARKFQCLDKGVVPSDGEFVELPIYTVISTFTINDTQNAADDADISPMGRQLFGFGGDGFNYFKDWGCNLVNNLPAAAGVASFVVGGPAIGVLGAVAGAGIESVVHGEGACGGSSGGVTMQDLQNSFLQLDTVLNAQNVVMQTTISALHQVQGTVELLSAEDKVLQNWVNVTQKRQDVQDLQMTQLGTAFDVFGRRVSRSIGTLNATLTQTNLDLLAVGNGLTRFEGQVAAQFVEEVKKIANITNFFNQRFQDVSTEFNRMHEQSSQHNAMIAEQFDLLSIMISNLRSQEPQRQRLAAKQWLAYRDMKTRGLNLFSSDLGRAAAADPFNLSPDLATRVMAILAYQRMYVRSGNVKVAAVTTLIMKCSTVFLTLNSQPISSFMALIKNLGGHPDCSTTNQNIICRCWIQVEESICDIKGGTTPTAPALAYWQTSTPVLETTNTCTSSPTDGTFAGRIIKNVTQFFDFQELLCAQGAYSSYSFYKVWSNVRQGYFQVPYSTSVCDRNNIATFMYPDATDLNSFNVIFVTSVYLIDSFEFRMQNITAWSSEIWGEVANDITILPDTPFRRTKEGQMGPVLKGAFMAFPPVDFTVDQYGGMLKVCEWDFIETVAKVDVTINGVTTSYDSVVTNDFVDDLLPKTGDLFIGNPLSSLQGASAIIDVLPAELTWTKNWAANCGKITYNLVPTAAGFSNANWTSFMKAPAYDAACGANVASESIQMIDSILHKCITRNTANTGKWCDILARFDVSVNVGTGIITFQSRGDDVQIVEVTFPAGTIEGLVGSVCPGISKGKNSTLSDLLYLNNPLSIPNKVKVIQTGGCPRVYGPFDIRPFQTENVTIPYCATPIVGQPETLTVYYQPGAGLDFIACNGTVDATVSTQPRSVAFPGSQIYIDERDATINDGTMIALGAVLKQNFIGAIDNKVVQFEIYNALGLADDDFKREIADDIAQMNQTHTSIVNNMAQQAANMQDNLTAPIDQYEQQAVVDQAQIAQYAQEQTDALNQIAALNGNISQSNIEARKRLDKADQALSDLFKNMSVWNNFVNHLTDGENGLDSDGLGDAFSLLFSWINPAMWGALIFGLIGGLLGKILGYLISFAVLIFIYVPLIDWWFPGSMNCMRACSCCRKSYDTSIKPQSGAPPTPQPPSTAPQAFAGHPFSVDKIPTADSWSEEIPLVLSKQQQHRKREPSPLFSSSSSSYNDDSIMNLRNDTF